MNEEEDDDHDDEDDDDSDVGRRATNKTSANANVNELVNKSVRESA